jgi:hypothetical protein
MDVDGRIHYRCRSCGKEFAEYLKGVGNRRLTSAQAARFVRSWMGRGGVVQGPCPHCTKAWRQAKEARRQALLAELGGRRKARDDA